MAGVGVGGGTLSILLVLWRVFLYINHKTVRSRCCGHTAEVGIDVDSPPALQVKVEPTLPQE